MSMTAQPSLEQIFEARIDHLATTLKPGSLHAYRLVVKSFLHYLRTNYPEVDALTALRRDPHFLGWLRHLCEQDPPLRLWRPQDEDGVEPDSPATASPSELVLARFDPTTPKSPCGAARCHRRARRVQGSRQAATDSSAIQCSMSSARARGVG